MSPPDAEPPVAVERLIHTLCLPLCVRNTVRTPHARVHAQRVAAALQHGGAWAPAPADGEAGTPRNDGWESRRRYQARAYWHPFVRRFLHHPESVIRLQRTDIAWLRVTFGSASVPDMPLTLKVLRCELFVFQPDIVILRLELGHDQRLPLEQLMLLIDRLRRVYPPYIDSRPAPSPNPNNEVIWFAGHCPVKVELLADDGNTLIGTPSMINQTLPQGEPPTLFDTPIQHLLQPPTHPRHGERPFEHWRTLLAPLPFASDSDGAELALHLQGDDRATVLSWLALDDPGRVSAGDWMRLCFGDEPGSSGRLPYAKHFMRDFEPRHCYDRYWYRSAHPPVSPSRILNCGYAFAFVGSIRDDRYFTNPDNGAHAIFRNIYSDLALIALYQKAALLSASMRLTQLVGRSADGSRITMPRPDEVRDFYEHFIEFTQRCWFDEVTPQEQGRELFAQWHQHLGIGPLYAEVRQELLDLVQYTELGDSRQLNLTVARFGALSILLASVGALAAVYALEQAPSFLSVFSKGKALEWVPTGVWVPATLLVATAGLALAGALAWAVPKLRRIWPQAPRR